MIINIIVNANIDIRLIELFSILILKNSHPIIFLISYVHHSLDLPCFLIQFHGYHFSTTLAHFPSTRDQITSISIDLLGLLCKKYDQSQIGHSFHSFFYFSLSSVFVNKTQTVFFYKHTKISYSKAFHLSIQPYHFHYIFFLIFAFYNYISNLWICKIFQARI